VQPTVTETTPLASLENLSIKGGGNYKKSVGNNVKSISYYKNKKILTL
jgi:hypothetical protein